MDITFRYFGDRSKSMSHKGIICVASRCTKNDDKTCTIRVGASFCSPRDVFSKDIARCIAVGRFFAFNTTLTLEQEIPRSIDIDLLILENLSKLPSYPKYATWIPNALNLERWK